MTARSSAQGDATCEDRFIQHSHCCSSLPHALLNNDAAPRARPKPAPSSTTTQQRPVVKQLLNAIRKTPWWAGGDVERNRTLFEELMERGNARCPHLGSTHEATTTD